MKKLHSRMKVVIEPKIMSLISSFKRAEFDHPEFGQIVKEEGKSYARSKGDPNNAIYFMESAVFKLTDETRRAHLNKKRKIIEMKRDHHFK